MQRKRWRGWWLEPVTFFKASERLKTGAVVPLIIYSQKIACEEHIFKERLAQNKITSCEYLLRLHYTHHINGPLVNTEIAPRRFFFFSFYLLFCLPSLFWHNPTSSCLQCYKFVMCRVKKNVMDPSLSSLSPQSYRSSPSL